MSQTVGVVLGFYLVVAVIISFIGIMMTLEGVENDDEEGKRVGALAFFLSWLWPVAAVSGLFYFIGWMGIQAFSPKTKEDESA